MACVHAGMRPNHTLTSHGKYKEVMSTATGEALGILHGVWSLAW